MEEDEDALWELNLGRCFGGVWTGGEDRGVERDLLGFEVGCAREFTEDLEERTTAGTGLPSSSLVKERGTGAFSADRLGFVSGIIGMGLPSVGLGCVYCGMIWGGLIEVV